MLSILIPVYNQDVRTLVQAIVDQCEAVDIDFQVLVFDDCSSQETKEMNSELSFLMGVNYTELSENHGRAKIRNKMARLARYHQLLFLDGDSGVISEDFISNYLPLIHKSDVVYGGRIYQSRKPEPQYMLHWKYGKTRESLPVKKRTLDPYLNFMSNNFLVTSKVMKLYPFDESVQGYGYEDLLFANKLKSKGIPIVHIDNETIHLGLETTGSMISKTNQSLGNLAKMYIADDQFETRLIKFYKGIKSWGLLTIVERYLRESQMRHLAKLKEQDPSIRFFNLWKLGRFIHHVQVEKSQNT